MRQRGKNQLEGDNHLYSKNNMKKSDIKTGSIFEIPLEKQFGYAYVKLIFSKDIQPDFFEHIIIKPYNLLRTYPMGKEEFDSKMFETDDLLMFPLLSWGLPNIRGAKKWTLKGFSQITSEDKIIPDFIDSGMEPINRESLQNECTSYGCSLVRNFQDKRIVSKEYESLKYLGTWEHASPVGIKILLTMIWMKYQKENILDYYSETDFEENFWLSHIYNKVTLNDIDFRNIKIEGRLKQL